MKTIILRAWPGAGKSYLANQIKENIERAGQKPVICSADHYFMRSGFYVFDQNLLQKAHGHSKYIFDKNLLDQNSILIVDNTNIDWKSVWNPYIRDSFQVGREVILVSPNTSWMGDVDECTKRNTHNVPKEVIARMMNKFQSDEFIMDKATSEAGIIHNFKLIYPIISKEFDARLSRFGRTAQDRSYWTSDPNPKLGNRKPIDVYNHMGENYLDGQLFG